MEKIDKESVPEGAPENLSAAADTEAVVAITPDDDRSEDRSVRRSITTVPRQERKAMRRTVTAVPVKKKVASAKPGVAFASRPDPVVSDEPATTIPPVQRSPFPSQRSAASENPDRSASHSYRSGLAHVRPVLRAVQTLNPTKRTALNSNDGHPQIPETSSEMDGPSCADVASGFFLLACEYFSGRYMATTWFVSHSAIREAYELVGLIAALLIGSALNVYVVPTQNLDAWQKNWDRNLQFVGIFSGWVTITCLFVILSVVGILSILRLIPEDPKIVQSFVFRNWVIFSSPILMLNLSIIMFIACLLGVGVYVYGYRVAIGLFIWAASGFLMLLYFNYMALHRTIKEFPPGEDTPDSFFSASTHGHHQSQRGGPLTRISRRYERATTTSSAATAPSDPESL